MINNLPYKLARRLLVVTRIAIAAIALIGHGAFAQEIAQIEMIGVPDGTTGLGFGFRSGTSPYKSEGLQSIDVVPLYLYEGKYLFARGTNLGAHIINKDRFTLDAVLRYDFTELDPEDDDYFVGLQPREQAWEAGLQGTLIGDWGRARLGYYRDVSSTNKGGQWDVAYRYPIERGNWVVSPYVSGIWMDSTKTNYYYGVSAAEAVPGREQYTAGGSLTAGLGLNTRYQLTDHFFVFGNAGLNVYGHEITDSPLVSKSAALSLYFGGAYLFGDNLGKPNSTWAGIRDWSWRVNYGYQANRNIFPDPMAGDLKQSEVTDSTIAGFTLGKIIQRGDRFDFWGKLALYRHFEEPLEDDMWSVSAYMTAMGKGYSPWSEKLMFRYGVSMGVSYAQDVPAAEQIKQADRGESDSRLLNYLEFQFDVPVDQWVKSRFTNNCFAGLVLVHRSGMFGSSDILGSVAGGSDWVTLSYECVR